MSWQLGLTLLVVGAAAAYLLHSWLRTWRAARGQACSGGCGCSSDKSQAEFQAFVPGDKLRLKARTTDRGGDQ